MSLRPIWAVAARPDGSPDIRGGVDSIGAGFNPYPLSDQSPVNAAITALVLPGAFGPYQTGLANRLAMGYGHHDRRGRPSVQNVSLFGAAQVGIVGRSVG